MYTCESVLLSVWSVRNDMCASLFDLCSDTVVVFLLNASNKYSKVCWWWMEFHNVLEILPHLLIALGFLNIKSFSLITTECPEVIVEIIKMVPKVSSAHLNYWTFLFFYVSSLTSSPSARRSRWTNGATPGGRSGWGIQRNVEPGVHRKLSKETLHAGRRGESFTSELMCEMGSSSVKVSTPMGFKVEPKCSLMRVIVNMAHSCTPTCLVYEVW